MPTTSTILRADNDRTIDATPPGSAQRLARSNRAAAVFVAMLAMLAGGACASRRCATIAPTVERFGSVTWLERATLLERRGDEVRLESWRYRIELETVSQGCRMTGRMPGNRGSARLACPGAPWTEVTFDYVFTDTAVVLWPRERDGIDVPLVRSWPGESTTSPFALTRIGPLVDVSETLQPIPQSEPPLGAIRLSRLCRVPHFCIARCVAEELRASRIPFRVNNSPRYAEFVILDFDRARAIDALRGNPWTRDAEIIDDPLTRPPTPTTTDRGDGR